MTSPFFCRQRWWYDLYLSLGEGQFVGEMAALDRCQVTLLREGLLQLSALVGAKTHLAALARLPPAAGRQRSRVTYWRGNASARSAIDSVPAPNDSVRQKKKINTAGVNTQETQPRTRYTSINPESNRSRPNRIPGIQGNRFFET